MFVKNAWYCAGWDYHVTQRRDSLVARKTAGERLAFYRKLDGGVVALEDRREHRQAALSLGQKEDAKPWVCDSILPSGSHMHAYRVFSTSAYGRIKELMEQTLGSSLIYLCSNAADLKSPELRPYIDRYIRGANDRSAVDRIKLMKLVCDSLAGEFGGRHELYERSYSGNWEDARVQALQGAIASSEAAACTALVDQCLSEYDLDGWRLPGFINPDDVNVISRRQAH